MGHRQVPTEAILDLRQRLEQLPSRCAERRQLIQATAQLYDVSESTLYRAISRISPLRPLHRSDYGHLGSWPSPLWSATAKSLPP